MDKSNLIARAQIEYCSGFASWHDLKRNYRELTTDDIFYKVISPINVLRQQEFRKRTTQKRENYLRSLKKNGF